MLFMIFGINIQDRSRDGMLIFSNNRLIRMFEKVGLQKKLGSYLGAGAVGIVDLPLEVMEPTHNKQSFANVKQYNHLLKSMESYLVQYWKDVGISQKGELFFWNDFGYQGAKWNEKPSDSIQYKRRRAVEIPDIVQCDICLKWRLLSLDTDINNERHHDIWTCAENKCHVPENLPSIPLGTSPPSSRSLNGKEKLLVDSIQQCQTKLKNLPLQDFTFLLFNKKDSIQIFCRQCKGKPIEQGLVPSTLGACRPIGAIGADEDPGPEPSGKKQPSRQLLMPTSALPSPRDGPLQGAPTSQAQSWEPALPPGTPGRVPGWREGPVAPAMWTSLEHPLGPKTQMEPPTTDQPTPFRAVPAKGVARTHLALALQTRPRHVCPRGTLTMEKGEPGDTPTLGTSLSVGPGAVHTHAGADS
ncbi:UNVERIFIED_CONTAM: hypothetical protein K2H54_060913 [Gekko kuhli]